MQELIHLLLVEDDEQDRFLVTKFLKRVGSFEIACTGTLSEAREWLGNNACQLIVTDLNLPDSTGIDAVKQLVEISADVPVVVLTGVDDVELGPKLVAAGAQDYLPKSQIETERLKQILSHALVRHRLWNQAQQAALYDPLTKLPNRTLFANHLDHTLEASRRRGEKFAIAFFDLDGFKPVNDIHGHAAGDQLLKQLAERLTATIRKSDMIARLGGDEIAWIMPTISDAYTASGRVTRMMAQITSPYRVETVVGPVEVKIGASIGISIYPDHGQDADRLVCNADIAMYQAKTLGGNRIQVFTGETLTTPTSSSRPGMRKVRLVPQTVNCTRILLIEDDDQDLWLIRKTMPKDWGFEITTVSTLVDAIDAARVNHYDAALLDLNLPDSSGIDTLRRLHNAVDDLPIVVLTRTTGDPCAIDALKAGAQDFLGKSFSDLQFWPRAVRYAIERHALQQQNEEALQRAQLANTDLLTGLPNRREFQASLGMLLSPDETPIQPFSLVIVDLVNFQSINETLGYLAGDEVLRVFGNRLKEQLGDEHFIARLGGDEFALLVYGNQDIGEINQLFKNSSSYLCRSIKVGDRVVNISIKVGIAQCPAHGEDASALMRAADLALRHAKYVVSAPIVGYTPNLGSAADHRTRTEDLLRSTMNEAGIHLLYQPIVDARSNELIGIEALLRWRDRSTELLPPSEFMAVAESTGLIAQIDNLVLREVCRRCRDWLPRARTRYPDLRFSLNVSVETLNSMDYASSVGWMIDEYGLTDTIPEIEITESALSNDLYQTLQQINRLTDLGVRTTLDDFGAEYSSLNYLRHLPVSKLKIDRSFVSNLPGEDRDRIIVNSLIELAMKLGFRIVVEGVETEQQRKMFTQSKDVCLQGFLIDQPMELAQLAEKYGIVLPSSRRSI